MQYPLAAKKTDQSWDLKANPEDREDHSSNELYHCLLHATQRVHFISICKDDAIALALLGADRICVSIERDTKRFKTALQLIASVCSSVRVSSQMQLRTDIEVKTIGNYVSDNCYKFKDANENSCPNRHDEYLESDKTSCIDLIKNPAYRKMAGSTCTELDCSSCLVYHFDQDCSERLHISP